MRIWRNWQLSNSKWHN